jgi:thiamine-phosphate pyrophosphorylase
VYPSSTKDADVIGPEALSALCAAVGGFPVVAIGGIQARHIPAVIAAGAHGVALVSAIFAATDVRGATQQLRETVDAALTASRRC